MTVCCRRKRALVAFRKGFYLIVCLAMASLTTYRVHLWLTQYTKMASKMMISAYDEHQRDLPFPLVTICNINPTRGHDLYNPQTSNPVNRGLDYEMFSDAYQGRVMENAPRNRLQVPIYQIVDRASHRLTDMLKGIFQSMLKVSNFLAHYEQFISSKHILLPSAAVLV
ncbi:hypothetical protein EG68_03832 [Paragonimus skrjabini miyazakii]|uniref:Uncharacterized protein n=1 Tax=Paragonimus skrjabini miyazakii TaxID=59628 RepID=A0A8S9Z7B5_9TREM|nr:hypothetical protein EG68_03832 [Paragonimus skrjabini miyazakii]